MPKIDLLPCPFCGKRDTAKCITVAECDCNDDPTEWDKTHYGVVCCAAILGGCGASTGWNHSTPEEAVEEWNTRASGWIPCSVKKPEAYKSVLVVIKDNDRYTWINIGETNEDGNWMIGGEFWYSKSDTSITHWMPTPELPKEVEE